MVLVLGTCLPGAVAATEQRDWLSSHYVAHPLVGQIVDGGGQPATFEQIVEAAIAAEFVLVGEIHPNPDHHLIQSEILAAMTEAGRRPAVVVEMIPETLQGRLDIYLSSSPVDAIALGDVVDWERRGWPAYALYRPIFDVALEAGLEIRGGNLDRDRIMAIGRDGPTPEEAARLGLDLPLDEAAQAAMADEMAGAHCGHMPESAIPGMIRAQRARDGVMAATMIEADGDGAVLIAGNGHVRRDRGVPAVLKRNRPEATILSIGLIAVTLDPEDIESYQPGRFDFAIFTPREDIKDHCAGLAERSAN